MRPHRWRSARAPGRPVCAFFSASCFANWATIRPPVAANGCPAASEEPLTLSRVRSMGPSAASRPSRCKQYSSDSQRPADAPARPRRTPRESRRSRSLQGESVPREQARDRIRGRHQQSVGAVHVVHRGGLGVDEPGQRVQRVAFGPLLGGQQRHRGAIGQRRRIAGSHGGVAALDAEHRLEGGEFPGTGIRPKVVAVEAQEGCSPDRRRNRGRRRPPCCGGWRRPTHPDRPV